tara:strand:- start:211 stop:444 length:234 start_codon:yes stop_codon:yes gene_type:complete
MTIRDLMTLSPGIVFNGKTGKEYSQMAIKTIDVIQAMHSDYVDADVGSAEYWEGMEACDKAVAAYLDQPASVLTSGS